MNVCVVMFYDNNIKNYGEINYEINKKYCEKYKLEIILSNKKKLENRHSAWERLPLLLDNILKFDYLIWIDADAFFYNDANNIVDIINAHRDVNFIFSNDIGDNNINTGVFIVKNSQYSIDFLSRWLYDEDLYNNNRFPYWWDQGVLIDMINKNILNIQQHYVSFQYGFLQHFHEHDKLINKTYIRHFAGVDHQKRYIESKKYYDEFMSI
jgi:hypothetical protein